MEKMSFKEKYFGDKAFYATVIGIALPIFFQNGVMNFVNLLDNIMVGRVGTDAVSAVSIISQFFFVFNLGLFGAVSGASIFGAQFFGSGDTDGLRQTFRFRFIVCVVVTIAAMLLLYFFHEPLIRMYLHEGGETGNMQDTMTQAVSYLKALLVGFPPFAISTCYANTLRDTGETRVALRASLMAVLINLTLNYVLIFGKLGFPVMGVRGAAIATVISRYVECIVLVSWTHTNAEICPFIEGAFRTLRIPAELAKRILKRGMPLFVNEILWSAGMATLAQSYSMRGLAVVAAHSIVNTVVNIFNISFISLGGALAIIVGNSLGAGKMKEARIADTRLVVFSVWATTLFSILMAIGAPFFPLLYETSAEVRLLARDLLWITAIFMPLHAFIHASYFTLRAGGKTMVTFIFDSGFMWLISIPLAYCLSRFTGLPIRQLYVAVQLVDIAKSFVGFRFLKSDIWLNNLVD